MSEFCNVVRKDELAGPLRREFKETLWTSEYQRLGVGDEDSSTYKAGLLIHLKLKEIRSKLNITFSRDINATTKLRAFVAFANYNLCILEDKALKEFKRSVADTTPELLMMHELAAIKMELPFGGEFTPDEIVQSIVDGSQVPIKVILENSPNLAGNPQLTKINWQHVAIDSNMGIFYSFAEDLWDECLWNDFRLKEIENMNILSPSDATWHIRLIASRSRHDNLTMHFFDMANAIQKKYGVKKLHEIIGVRGIKSITKNGRKQVINFVEKDGPTDDDMRLMAARLYASEPYYMDLLHEQHEKIGGATINDLLNAWSAVSRIAKIFKCELKNTLNSNNDKDGLLPSKFAPVLQIDALIHGVVGAANLKYNQAKAIVEFLSFRGLKDQEIWAQPLVPISLESVSPMFAATTGPNLRRIVDVWLKQLDVDLGRRGSAFETYIRKSLSEAILASPLLSKAKVVKNDFTFRPPDSRNEQIDAVLVIGDLVIIAEAKCILHPTEAKQIAFHRKTITDAVQQVKRKVKSVEDNLESFRNHLQELEIKLPEVFRVQAAVILNGAIHVGFEVDGVPILDMNILDVFFSGELIDLASRNANGEMVTLKKRIFYSDIDEAAKIAIQFFRDPPQMEGYIRGVKPRWVPLLQITSKDWHGQYLTFDCKPELSPS